MLVEFGAFLKSEITKPKHSFLQDQMKRGEFCAINLNIIFGVVIEYGVLIKGKIRKPIRFLFQDPK